MNSDRKHGILAVMIAHNELRCIKTNSRILLEELRGTDSELVIVVNCSVDGLGEWLIQQKQISSVVIDEHMEGFGKILSVIREEFGDERDVLLLRANYFFTPGSIWSMKSILDTEYEIAAVGPVSNAFANEQSCQDAQTYEKALDIQALLLSAGMEKTAWLDMDVMLIRNKTFAWIDKNSHIPRDTMRKYMQAALKNGNSFAVDKSAVCFAVCQTNDSFYRAFDQELYQKEKLQQLLYYFGDVTYEGVHLYKYLEPDILNGINYYNGSQNTEKNLGSVVWGGSDQIVVSTEEEAEQTKTMLNSLPMKDVLFVTLPLRRMYQGQYIHTAMEPYIASLDEERYLDLECVSNITQEGIVEIPTKNRYPFLSSSIPKIYGITEIDKEKLFQFLWNHFIHPLEELMDIQFADIVLRGCFLKAAYLLKQRNAYLKFYKSVLKKVRPKVVIYSHGQNILLTYLRDAAMELKIPTLEIAHGVNISGVYHKQLAYADHLLVFNEWIAEKCRLSGNDKVFGIGKPGIYESAKVLDKKDLKIVISFVSSLEMELIEYAKNLAHRLDKKKYLVIYKIHGSEM